MLNSRRTQAARAYEEPQFDANDAARDDDPMAELARIVDADIRDALGRGNSVHDDIARALEAELSNPFAVETTPRGTAVRPGERIYDPWDDDALADLPDDFALAEAAPNRIEEGVLPPHPEVEERAAPKRSRWMLRAGLAALVVAGLGGAVYALMPGGIVGDPVLVTAPEGDYKIVPKDGDTIDEPVEGQAVFNAANGVPPKSEERFVPRDETVPALPEVTQQVNRVILPDGQEISAEPSLPEDVGPRRVRTVLVKPDGTIIDAPDGPVPSLPSPTQSAPLADGGPLVQPNGSPIASLIEEEIPSSAGGLPPLPSDNVTLGGESSTGLPDQPVGTDVAMLPPSPDAAAAAAPALPPLTETPAAAGPVVDAPIPPARPAAPVQTAAAEPVPVAPAPVAAAPAPAPAAPAPVAAADGPLDLAAAAQAPAPVQPAPAAPAPVATAPAASAGAYVQVASQKSEADATNTFAALQRKFPSVLGGLAPDIQRADLGAKGVFYRIRVPQPSREAAVRLCESLKAAGGDCLIARN